MVEEVDVVGAQHRRLRVIGECEWTSRPMPKRVLDDLLAYKLPAIVQAGELTRRQMARPCCSSRVRASPRFSSRPQPPACASSSSTLTSSTRSSTAASQISQICIRLTEGHRRQFDGMVLSTGMLAGGGAGPGGVRRRDFTTDPNGNQTVRDSSTTKL